MTGSTYTVAVVGVTGLIGEELVRTLAERDFPFSELRLYASERTAGGQVTCGDREMRVELLDRADFDGVDLVFFAATEAVSAEWIGRATEAGATAIDLSQLYADDPDVPLVVAAVNGELVVESDARIVASPCAGVIQLAPVLAPLQQVVGLARVAVAGYEPASRAGRQGVEALSQQTVELLNARSVDAGNFPHRLAFNLVPHLGEFLAGGATRGEQQLIAQTRRVLALPELAMSATSVLVPVFFGLGHAVTIETETPLPASDAQAALRDAASIIVEDDPAAGRYPLPTSVVGGDAISVGRIRDDEGAANGLSLWICSDNTRCAALNAVAIAELLVGRA